MNNKHKVTLIIFAQIVLIFTSFVILAILESQTTLLGNSVNVAGKNRFLSIQFLDEVKDWAYVKNPDASPEKVLEELEENIYLIKNGGTSGKITIHKLDMEFEEEWIQVSENLTNLKTAFMEFKSKKNSNLKYDDISDLETATFLLVQTSDNLVSKLGLSLEKKSEFSFYLGISLLIINVGTHILLVLIMIMIFRIEFAKNTKVEKLVTIGELSARLAHDLRTPLSNINLSAQLLANNVTEKSNLEKIKSIEDAVKRISHQINDVLDFVKTRNPNLMVWKLNQILKSSIEKINIPDRIEVMLPSQDFTIKCDKDQFEILFINLILNAIDAIDNKGIIRIKAEKYGGKLLIVMEDSGKGFPDDYIDQIFDPLFTLKERGTGLGLASCKNIVESHGGKISVSLNPTKFKIILPQN